MKRQRDDWIYDAGLLAEVIEKLGDFAVLITILLSARLYSSTRNTILMTWIRGENLSLR